jgi:hypothetical protein
MWDGNMSKAQSFRIRKDPYKDYYTIISEKGYHVGVETVHGKKGSNVLLLSIFSSCKAYWYIKPAN